MDISTAALEMARANAVRNQVHERIEFIEGGTLGALPPDCRFSLIVSNPPYVPSGEIDSLHPEVRDHDPRLALDGGVDGLDFYRLLATEVGPWIQPGGAVIVEFGDDQGPSIRDLWAPKEWRVDELIRDYSGRERILIARRSD